MSRTRSAGLVILALTLLAGIAPLFEGPAELPVPQHHLLHAGLVFGAALAGVLMAAWPARASTRAPGWLAIAFIAPLGMMVLMWPSDYSFFEQHPSGHALEHVGIIAFSFLSGYAGTCFAPSVGWIAGASAFAMAVLAAGGFGIAPPSAVPAVAAQSTPAGATTGRGELVFQQNCAVCHGAVGAGGSGPGPALKNERSRKDLKATIAWIENPAPPMPKLYPQVLSAADVAAVAAYVHGL